MLKQFAEKNIVIFDGAMGTVIQSVMPDVPEVNEMLNITHPEIIENIHRKYFEAGANVAVTNTFGANRFVLSEYGLEDKVADINETAVRIARIAAKGMENKFIALSVGPGSRLPSLGQISYDSLRQAYREQMRAAVRIGVDLVMIETCQDLLQIKAALGALMEVNKELGTDIPASVSFTVEENSSLLVGTDIATVASVLSGYDIFSLGINCGFGPDKMAHPLAELAKHWGGRLYLSSNAGMPVMKDGTLTYPMAADEFASRSKELLLRHLLGAVGGCCGTSFEHIKALSRELAGVEPVARKAENYVGSGYASSTYGLTSVYQKPAPTLIGERANATGSKAFRELLKADDYPSMANVARSQQDASHIIDISVALSGRDEAKDMASVVPILNTELTAPLMIDSTSPAVIRASLKQITGKPVINSVNFEDGGSKLHEVLSMLREFPAVVVALTIDETGMAQTKDEKLTVARRICRTWIDEYRLPPEDLLIDFLTFAVTSGDEQSKLAAVHTIEAIKEFKKEYPAVGTVLGVSNVSFGLSPSARTVLNAVFLDKCVKAGLDAAIVHAEKVIPLSNLSDEDIRLSEELLDGKDGALDRFIERFAGVKEEENAEMPLLSPQEELYNKVIKGDSHNISAVMESVLNEKNAADVLNTILLPAMQEVGRLFNAGKLLLPFVLKSAEVMRECSKLLESLLKRESSGNRGKVVLATVKGDVHDIGKNLVDVILSGNGYEVINLGTKVNGEDIANAAIEHNADAVGMSGLLVKSVEIMKDNIQLLKDKGLDLKVLLGGAALSEEYVRTECDPIMPGRVFYCKDAFSGVTAMEGGQIPLASAKKAATNPFDGKKWDIPPFNGTVESTFMGRSSIERFNPEEIALRLGRRSLFEGKWGLNQYPDREKAKEDMEKELAQMLKKLENIVEFKGVYGFFPVEVEKNKLYVNGSLFAEFPEGGNGECFTDLFATTASASLLPLQLVTLGSKAQQYIAGFYSGDKYSDYYEYHGLLASMTEAAASIMQERLGKDLLINGKAPEKTLRYSFGYPLCPDLKGNIALCGLLNSGEIGVSVNDNFQMEPVYSTCAMVSWHPAGKY